MLATKFWQLPPTLRSGVAAWIIGPHPAQHGLLSLANPLLKPTHHQHQPRRVLGRSQQYATLHTDETSSQLGAQPQQEQPPPLSATGESITPAESQGAHPALPESSSAQASEKDSLLALARERAQRSSNSIRRRRLRHRIQGALEHDDPLPALREIAYPPDQSVKETDKTVAGATNVLPNTTKAPPSTSSETNVECMDLDFIQRNKPLPTPTEYPHALPMLFQPSKVSVALHNACQKLKLSLQTEIDFTSRRASPRTREIKICALHIDIPDVCQETATGEGPNKQLATQAAWLLLVSKLHLAGTLKDLFPSESETASPANTDPEEIGPLLTEPVEVDKATLKLEKDAKTEIYSYAAGLGLVPKFETTLVQPRTPRARMGKRLKNSKKPKALVQVRIELPEQHISVTAAGKDLLSAEIAAGIAFKEQAERQHQAVTGGTTTHHTAFSVLNIDTASQFFEFYKNREAGLSLEIEHERLEGSMTVNSARLTVNGTPIGSPVSLMGKKKAEAVAYLVAAVEVAKSDPPLLEEFAQKLKKGKGKILRSLASIDLEVDYEALQTMRHALLEAREAGLPDHWQTLDAEPAQHGQHHQRHSSRLTSAAQEVASAELLSQQTAFNEDPSLEELRSKKASLPMNHYRQQVLTMVGENQYSIVIGATGSGKTTQVPQILFEAAIQNGNGSACNIICTQPRRIAATSVAQRVATERNEELRKTVGYQVRFDAKQPHEPYGITYCTTGLLLEKLKHGSDDTLDGASHIIIDEVHERDLNVDFLLIVLKRAIRRRRAEGRHVPKVVLMSATLDPELFAGYFGDTDGSGNLLPCPALRVPGRTFPVKEMYLGSVMYEMLEKRGAEAKRLLDEDPKSVDFLKVETAFSDSRSQSNANARAETVIDWKRERQVIPESDEEISGQQEKEEALVPVSLVATTIAHICSTSQDGAILTFLPGLEEILLVQKMLLERRPFAIDFADGSKFQICLLHSTVPKEEQSHVFTPSPPGCRKIILSTNIAETSVTVPEVKYVVDTGKLRETRYDQTRRITKLQCVWESKSNLKQRAGRAGRVQDGFYYALFSKERADSLRAVGLPELLRSDLQETCLSIQAQNFGEDVAAFLGQAIEPPAQPAVDAAIENLMAIEALTADQQLTALGRVLSQLPVHPTLGKMIILGVIFKCLDPMILLGVASEERSLFLRPLNKRLEAERAHRVYAGESQSDQIAFLSAFNELRTIRDENGMGPAMQRGHEQFLHMGAFRVIDQTARQIEDILHQCRLLKKEPIRDLSSVSKFGPSALNRNANNTDLIRGLLLAGSHPNLAAKSSFSGIVFRSPSEQSVLMHPSSLNAESRSKSAPVSSSKRHPYGSLFAYRALSRSADGNTLFMRDSTHVTPLMAALFGGQLKMTGAGRLEMDEWLPFFLKTPYQRAFSTRLILEFRKALDRVLHGAFSSLSEIRKMEGDGRGGKGGGRGGGLADDPITDRFAGRVVEVLGKAAGTRFRNDGAWIR